MDNPPIYNLPQAVRQQQSSVHSTRSESPEGTQSSEICSLVFALSPEHDENVAMPPFRPNAEAIESDEERLSDDYDNLMPETDEGLDDSDEERPLYRPVSQHRLPSLTVGISNDSDDERPLIQQGSQQSVTVQPNRQTLADSLENQNQDQRQRRSDHSYSSPSSGNSSSTSGFEDNHSIALSDNFNTRTTDEIFNFQSFRHREMISEQIMVEDAKNMTLLEIATNCNAKEVISGSHSLN